MNNYQRNPASVPVAWANSTGKVWGKGGDWPIVEPLHIDLTRDERYQCRRICVRYLAHAGGGKEFDYWSRYLKVLDKQTSGYIGISGFIPDTESLRIVRCVKGL